MLAGESLAIAAEAGPVLMPHGPWPAHTKSRSIPLGAPMKGRPSIDCGRAQSLRPTTSAPSTAGSHSAARRMRSVPIRSGSGSIGRNVEPRVLIPPALARG